MDRFDEKKEMTVGSGSNLFQRQQNKCFAVSTALRSGAGGKRSNALQTDPSLKMIRTSSAEHFHGWKHVRSFFFGLRYQPWEVKVYSRPAGPSRRKWCNRSRTRLVNEESRSGRSLLISFILE